MFIIVLAVIGGLVWATVATLTFVPVVFSWVHARPGGRESPPSGANDRLPTEG